MLQALGEGPDNREGGRRLGISLDTERNRMAAVVTTKPGAHPRLRAPVIAVRDGPAGSDQKEG